MKKEKIASLSIIAVALLVSGIVLVTTASAQESQVVFPVAELGNCADKESCKAYCDKSENMSACIAFAKKNRLMDDSEIRMAENILKNGGPGGCKNKGECESFCESVDNIDQCVSFAEKHNLMPQEELAEAKKIQSALKRGVKMPPCKNKKDCDAYCGSPENMEMCMNFAVEAGFMSQDEMEEAGKMLQALKKGVKPPACRGKKECEAFCSRDENLDQCVTFAEAAGFMTPEQVERTRRTGGKGPGGCRGAECETFCNDPKNQDICYQFSVDNDLLSDEDKQRMNEGSSKTNEILNQAPPEVAECVKGKIGEVNYEKIRSGKMYRQEGDPFRECFDEYYKDGKGRGPEDGHEMPPGDHRGERPPGTEGFDPRMMGRPQEGDTKYPEGFDPRQMQRPPEGDFRPPEGMMQRPPEGMMPPQGSSYPSSSSEMMPHRDDSQFSRPPTSETPPPSSAPTPPPPPPEGESAPQARLSDYLTATIFDAESAVIKIIRARE